MWHRAPQAKSIAREAAHATPLATGENDVGPRRAAGQRSGSPGESRDNIGHTGQASLDAAARRKSAGRVVASGKTGARRAKRTMWHRARQAQSVAREETPATPLAKGKKDVGHGGQPGDAAVRRARIGQTVCELGARHEHPWTSRSGAEVRAASSQAARPERGAQSARVGTARRRLRASRARPATPLATGEKDVGPRRAAGQRSGSPGENRDNVLRIWHTARAARPERGAQSARCGTARDRFRA